MKQYIFLSAVCMLLLVSMNFSMLEKNKNTEETSEMKRLQHDPVYQQWLKDFNSDVNRMTTEWSKEWVREQREQQRREYLDKQNKSGNK